MTLSDEMSEQATEALVSIVKDHYKDPQALPLLLSKLGQRIEPEHRKALISSFGGLAGAVKVAGTSQLVLIHSPDRPGKTAVALPSNHQRVEAEIVEEKYRQSNAEAKFSSLPLPMQIAFCLSTEAGEEVVTRINPPVRYRKIASGQAMPPGYKLIDGRFRVPGLKLSNATPADLDRLWKNYLAWADLTDVPTESLTKAPGHTNALERFLAAQEPTIVTRIVLPGDIAAILLRHS